MDREARVLYVGKAKNLKKRVSSYFVNTANLLEKTKILVSQIKKIRYVIAESEIEALLLETSHIKKYMPKFNAKLRDGKRYPLIRITIKDKYPKVLVARRYEDDPSDKRSLYFGPFPNSGAVRLVLRTIRRIFPFQSVLNHPKKLCLYYHLGLCPCPGVFNRPRRSYRRDLRGHVGNSIPAKDYRKNINYLISFLKGNTHKVLRDLEKERDILSKNEEFEKAETVQKKIDAILFVTSPAFNKFDYKTNPNLESDLRNNELSMLKKMLFKEGMKVKNLSRIECFDISNISGTNATGSMVVFVNGEKDLSQYRKFRIRNLPNFVSLPNDFAMMQQVISRRLNHKEWPYPDLIIVDGGKGQVSSAVSVLKEQNVRIPIIGLAKREETIVIPLILNRHSGNSERSQVPSGTWRSVEASRISKRPNRFWTRRVPDGTVPFGTSQSRTDWFWDGNPSSQNDDRGSFKEISLPKNSPALHLVMRIRDEAHRFAIQYHRKLRSKSLVP